MSKTPKESFRRFVTDTLLVCLGVALTFYLVLEADFRYAEWNRGQRFSEKCCKDNVCVVNDGCFVLYENLFRRSCGEESLYRLNNIFDHGCKSEKNHSNGTLKTLCEVPLLNDWLAKCQ